SDPGSDGAAGAWGGGATPASPPGPAGRSPPAGGSRSPPLSGTPVCPASAPRRPGSRGGRSARWGSASSAVSRSTASRTAAPARSRARRECGWQPVADLPRARVAVIGGGPAGIAAAISSAESGADTILVDEGTAPGGQIWRGGGAASPLPRKARRWVERLQRSGARRLRAAVVASVATDRLLLETGAGPAELAFEALVLATG